MKDKEQGVVSALEGFTVWVETGEPGHVLGGGVQTVQAKVLQELEGV